MSAKKLFRLAVCLSAIALFALPTFAIMGIGVHYGMDYSLSMEDVTGEQTTFNDLKLSTSTFGTTTGYTPPATISGKDLPITVIRTNFQRHAFNLGGKIYIDIIPFINAIELSANYGMWQYEGMIAYPDSISLKPTQPSDPNAPFIDRVDVGYDTVSIMLKDLDLDNPFLKNTPFAKLNIDLTIRKTIVKFPPAVNLVKIYGGAGVSLNFATPILSSGFIEKAIGTTLNQQYSITDFSNTLFNQDGETMKKLGGEFMKQLFTPHYGAHLDLGAMFKLPIVPIGIYVDGKYMIPFGQLDDNVEQLKMNGILLNMGLAFAL